MEWTGRGLSQERCLKSDPGCLWGLERKKALPVGESLPSFSAELQKSRGDVRASGSQASLPPSFTPNGRLALPLPLSAGLFIKTTLPELGIEAGSLNFSFEPTECPIEALVVLDDDFQTNHAPFKRFWYRTSLKR